MTDEQIKRALSIQKKYRIQNQNEARKEWDIVDYAAGFTGDVGDLMKLIMAHANLRRADGDLDRKLKHELGDCIWSIIVVCNELGLDPKECLETTLTDLEERLKGV